MALKAVVPNLDDVAPHFHELYTEKNGQFELQAIEGMRTQADVDRLTTALGKERTDHKATKDKFHVFADMDIVDVQAKLDRIPELEAAAAGKIDETKIQEIVETRIKTRIAPIERERDKLKQTVVDKDGEIQVFKTEKRKTTVSTAISAAAKKAGVVDTALEDAILLGERIFDVGEDGAVSVKDNVGFTPGIDPTTWFTELQPKRPHWWGGSAGGGANPGGGRPMPNNPWSLDHWNMTEQGKIFKENPSRANQLAASAGTTVGGPKPKKKS